MPALTRWVLAHKRTVVAIWAVLTVAGMVAAGPATRRSTRSSPSPARRAGKPTSRSRRSTTAPVATACRWSRWSRSRGPRRSNSPVVRSDLEKLDEALRDALPGARLASYASTGDRTFVSDDGTTTFALVYPRPDVDSMFGENPEAQEAASTAIADATVAGEPVRLTGFDALIEDSGETAGSGVLIEALVGGFGALLVLTFVFASFLAVVPLMMAAASILTTFLLLLGLTELTSVSPIVQFLIALLGLGVAIDYSLLVVSRWREERSHGYVGDDAVNERWRLRGEPSSSAGSLSRSACSP